MAKEPDQTRWVGIRPTDPSENIPVTESAPLTDILVAPSAGNPEFLTLTKKRTPAIADLQAIESFVRMIETKQNVGAPNYDHDLYTVPPGKIFRMEYVLGYSWQADPTFITFNLHSGGVDYPWLVNAYGVAFTYIRSVVNLIFNEAEIVRIHWSGTLAGTDVCGMLVGHLIDKY